jgi:O-methyltransferase involved in polyketide biosynthesis
MGNDNISITAEFVSIMRSKNDPKNLYFVSKKGFRLYKIVKTIISERRTQAIFDWRLKLSAGFDKKIFDEKPEQVIDLAAGYSLRGFNLCSNNSNLIYIDSDLPNVILRKKQILEKMCLEKNIVYPKNYFIVPIDVLGDDLSGGIKNLIGTNKKTLIAAEGLTSYFTEDQFLLFISNIKSFLGNFSSAEFYSHENVSPSKNVFVRFLRGAFMFFLVREWRRKTFSDAEKFKDYLRKLNVNFKIDTNNNDFLFYSIFK